MRPLEKAVTDIFGDVPALLSIYRNACRLHALPVAMRSLCDRLHNLPAAAWLECAQALSTTEPLQAARLLESARARHPSDLPLLQFSIELLRRLGDTASLIPALQQRLQLDDDKEAAALELAIAQRDEGHMRAAADTVLRHLVQPDTVERILGAATFLEGCRRTADAYAVCRRGIAHGLRDVRLYYDAGIHALSLGRFDEAGPLLRAALASPAPEWAALLPLALGQRHSPGHLADLVLYQDAWHSRTMDEPSRAFAGFALAKAHDDLGDFASAARYARVANSIVRRRQSAPSTDWAGLFRSRLSPTARPIPRLPAPARDDARPVFIIGLPRTGTTLVAELLGRHDAITNRGELHWISFLDEQLRQRGRLHDPAALQAAARCYRTQLRQDDAPTPFYIDKNPLNFRHLEFIAALFPDACVIHCRRSPRDTALSNWMQMLGHSDLAWSYDFDEIAAYFSGHDQLMSQWPAQLQLPVHTVDYEMLVQQPQDAVAALLRFIGLPASDLLASAGNPNRSIGTASVWQARQPVTAGSIGRWRHYAEHLPELVDRFAW